MRRFVSGALMTGAAIAVVVAAGSGRTAGSAAEEPGRESAHVSDPVATPVSVPADGDPAAAQRPESAARPSPDPEPAPARQTIPGTAVPVGRSFAQPSDRKAAADALQAWSDEGRAAAASLAAKTGRPLEEERGDRAFRLVAVRNGRIYRYTTHNINAAISVAADQVRNTQPYNVNGSGLTVGLWDAGSVRATHQEYVGRVTLRNSASVHYHSTHVAGTLGASGVEPNALGMAPAVAIDSYDWNNDIAEMAAVARATPDESGVIEVSNHSYGLQTGWEGTEWYGSWGTHTESDGFGLYDIYAAMWDSVCYDSPYFLPFKSAGNDRSDTAPSPGAQFSYFDGVMWKSKAYDPAVDPPSDGWESGGYDTIPYIGNAKNIMTVGAVGDAVSGGVRSLSGASMTAYSGWGPADDGRVKPDIVANGVSLWSTYSSHDSAYATLSGTSMAAPNASGSAVLLVDLYRSLFPGDSIRASMLKGLIIHTADDLGNPGPDYRYGWGLMNTRAAADLIVAHHSRTNTPRMVRGLLTQAVRQSEVSFFWDGVSNIRTTLCWTDYPGMPHDTLDDRTPTLVHDLDLRVVSPSGQTNFPYRLDPLDPGALATRGDNSVDNVEVVDIASPPESGTYRALVTLDGDLVDTSQAFSLIISGSTSLPEIQHTPLGNSTNVTPYTVSALIDSDTPLVATNTLLHYRTGDTGGVFEAVQLTNIGSNAYEAVIPAQPLGTRVQYYLSAQASSGLEALLPTNGGDAPFEFLVTVPVELTVGWTPVDVGESDPPYGRSSFPSGVTVHASASAHTDSFHGFRYNNGGWIGTGSVPDEGDTNELDFVIESASTLTWRWVPAFSLTQTSTLAAAVNTTDWWPVGSYARTVEAPLVTGGGFPLRLASWYLDGVRVPDATGTTPNPVTNILMNVPRTAVAKYLPASENKDGDALPDWWELFYFGSTAAVHNVDSDEDGFTNVKEYQDGTDPRDPGSTPSPPSIAHIPLAVVATTPAPWTVSAVVTDNHQVVSAAVKWTRNGGVWQSAPMLYEAASGAYTGAIIPPGGTGDRIVYQVTATDNAGLTAVSGPFTFDVRYPVAVLTPETFGTFALPHNTSSNAMLVVSNAGHAALEWSISIQHAGMSNDVENGQAGWTHSGNHDVWHISSARAYSGTQSWFFGSESLGAYPDNANAALVTPPVLLSSGAKLRFRQWLRTETPKDSVYAWDGCYVEISTNAGAGFAQITPTGGYNRIVYGHSASPFPDGTPCFVGTGGWQEVEFDLSAYALQVVQLGFRFGSDGYVTAEGWYIDDIRVTPDGRADGWLTLDPDAGSTVPGAQGQSTLWVSTAAVEPGETVAAGIVVSANDPVSPEQIVPISLHNLSRVIRVTQPERGSIVPGGNVYVVAGESADFLVSADAYYHIQAIVTNGAALNIAGAGLSTTNFTWSNIVTHADLTATMTENLVTNGVPEWWLAANGLTNAPMQEEAIGDADGDLMPAWAEYVAGTDPNAATSVFSIASVWPWVTNWLEVVVTNEFSESQTQRCAQVGGVVLSWPSVTGRLYALEVAPAAGAEGALLRTNMPATPPLNVVTQHGAEASTGFYRLRVERE